MTRPQLNEHRAALRAVADGGSQNGAGPALKVTLRKGKLVLPGLPDVDDLAGQCRWLTCVLALDGRHPIVGGALEGLRGPEGHVVLRRADAPSLRFEPATKLNAPARLIEALNWRMLPTDGPIHALDGGHCRQISHVVRMLCGASETVSEMQETAAIVGTFLQGADPAEGLTTHGTAAQRYEAAVALRRERDERTGRPIGAQRYLIDSATGELVVAVSDLADAARRHVGSSLARGWLDARMDALGWARVCLQGFGLAGRAGRNGPHARINAYRGHLPSDDEATNQPAEAGSEGDGVNT